MDKRYKNTFLTMGEMAEVNNFLTQLSDKDKAGFINFVRLSCITYIQDYPGESLTNEEVCSRCMPIWTTLTDIQKEQFSKNDVLEQIRACQQLLDLMPIEGPMIITKDKLDKKQKTTDETAIKKRKKTASTSEKEKSNETEKSEGTPQNPGEPAAKKRKKSTPQSPSSKKEKKVKDPNEPKKPM
uniref:Uncharacterized protein n=1 Tax=Acrobeloides nanus TaxID=290746 RepID=A0A914EGP5_9BILA